MHRKHVFMLCATSIVALFVIAAPIARGGDDDKCVSQKSAATSKAQPALEKLKTLAGEWVFADGENKGKLAVVYTVSSGGTAVVERLFPGSDHEMTTVFHVDGDRLMMTHYCAVGNQPRMHAEPATDRLAFAFTGGSNVAAGDGHMNAMTLTFVDDDHFTEQWTFKGAGDGHSSTFRFERKK